MKRFKYIIYALVVMVMFSSCATYNAPTKYQGRNLYKFTYGNKKTYKSNKSRSHKYLALRKRGSYWHGAVSNRTRKEIRQRFWSERSGGGQLYK